MADIFRLVGAVDAVQGVLVALVKIDRPRAQRISRASGNALWVGAEPSLDLRRRDPIRPVGYMANRSDAGPGQCFLPDRHAVAERLASRQDVIEKTRVGIDKDRARLLFARVVDNMPAIGLRDGRLRIRRMGQQLPVPWGQTGIRRRCERRLHATAELKPEQPKKQQRQSGPRHRQSSRASRWSICCSNSAENMASLESWVRSRPTSRNDLRSTPNNGHDGARALRPLSARGGHRSLAEPKTKEPRTHRGSSYWR